jgi:hypothetical protein
MTEILRDPHIGHFNRAFELAIGNVLWRVSRPVRSRSKPPGFILPTQRDLFREWGRSYALPAV